MNPTPTTIDQKNDLSNQPEDLYVVDNSAKSTLEILTNAHLDFLSLWLSKSSGLKRWVKVWLAFLMIGVMAPMAFLPHAFAIVNLAAVIRIMYLNGKELIRIRGVNKNMGWPHVVAWTPVLIVNILTLTTDLIGGERLTWEAANDNQYEQARFVILIYSTVVLGISCLFDSMDTYLYYYANHKGIDRSRWTLEQLKGEQLKKPAGESMEEGSA